MKYLYSLLAVVLISSCAVGHTDGLGHDWSDYVVDKTKELNEMWNGKTERVLIENLGAPGSLYTSSNTKYLTYIDIRELGYSGTKSSVCEYTFRIENDVITNVSIKGSGGYYFLCYNN